MKIIFKFTFKLIFKKLFIEFIDYMEYNFCLLLEITNNKKEIPTCRFQSRISMKLAWDKIIIEIKIFSLNKYYLEILLYLMLKSNITFQNTISFNA